MGSHFRLLRSFRWTASADSIELARVQGCFSEARQRHSIMMTELQDARRDLAAIAQRLVPESGASPSESNSALNMSARPSARASPEVSAQHHALHQSTC